MILIETSEYRIRNYSEDHAASIGEFNKVLELSYRYNADFIPENIFCAVNSKGDILGVAHLEPHFTWHMLNTDDRPPESIYKLVLKIELNAGFPEPDGLKKDLLKALIMRAEAIATLYPQKKIRVFVWLTADDNQEMDFYLAHGFTAYQSVLAMKYDLTQDIPEVPEPEGIKVIYHKLETEEELEQYHKTEYIAFSGAAWSMNTLRWYRGVPEWANFSAFHKNLLVGSMMVWMITNGRSATENIFVLPEGRGKGVARYMVTKALKHLKSSGKTCATLSVAGSNKNAIALYKSLGYKMLYVILEVGYDLF